MEKDDDQLILDLVEALEAINENKTSNNLNEISMISENGSRIYY